MMSSYNYRYVAQIIIEATTPLKVGSGESDLFVDAPVMKDWNGLPMILGTSIAGVLRDEFRKNYKKFEDEIFGKDNGSRVIISNAHLLDENMKLHQGLGLKKSAFLDKYQNLPIREHTAIDDKGVAKEHSKFNEEVVFSGSRFKFEIELIGDESDEKLWQNLLNLLTSPLFRLGSGSTKGFGEVKVVSCREQTYIIGKDYDIKPSDLNKTIGDEKNLENSSSYTKYKIKIKADDFFSFGAGYGDDEVDDVFVTEEIVKWSKNRGEFSKKNILLPASSLKGALSHRVAFHYNKIKRIYADEIALDEFEKYIGENNDAVRDIFGHKKERKDKVELGAKGKAIFSDVFKEFNEDTKIFDHVKIDRFTGGAIDSALYNEKVVAQKDEWDIEIILAKDINKDTKEAFEKALDDLCSGMLPLGGKVNRGHGVFIGTWEKESKNA